MIKLKSLLTETISSKFPMVVYHGGKMEASKPVIFVTRYPEVAQSYANTADGGGKVHKFMVDLKNPARDEIVVKLARQFGIEGSVDDYSKGIQESPPHEYLSPEMVGYDNVKKMVAALVKLGYDGAWMDGDFSPDNSFTEYDSIVIWDMSKLKPI